MASSRGAMFTRRAPREPRLLPHALKCCSWPHVPQLLFGQCDAAKFTARRELRITPRKTRLDTLVSRDEVLIIGFAPAPEAEVAHESSCLLSGFHEEADRPGELSPLRVLARQAFSSGSRQSV